MSTRRELTGRENRKFQNYEFSSIFFIFGFFMAVLGSGRVSMAFPEAVRSILAEQCSEPSHRDPIYPKNYIFWHFVMLCAPDVMPAGAFWELKI